jgi:DNA-binding HxlR family transcriptional regulator
MPEIIFSIGLGHESYIDILNHVEGLSHTELNRKINILIIKNIIVKKDHHPRSGYILTEYGEDIKHILNHFLDIERKYEDVISNT